MKIMTKQTDSGFSVDSAFPGGNIVVDRIEGDNVCMHQDLRDSDWWFYWCFRVRCAENKKIIFHSAIPGIQMPITAKALRFKNGLWDSRR